VKIINIVGARPNFMKIAPVMDAMGKSKVIKPLLLHTGQHYDEKMSSLFFEELKIPKPDIYLGVGSGTHAKQVAHIMEKFDDVCEEEKPDAILVVGDVNSTMACSLVASKLGIKIIHLEAGLRSFDRRMPEEINRLVTDSIADLLLTPSEDGSQNLLNEGISADKIQLVGNIMIDTLFRFLPVIEKSSIIDQLHLTPQQYLLVTLHRPSNVDQKENLKEILTTFREIQKKIKIVFPVHPRTMKNINEFGFSELINEMKNLIITEPFGYLDFQRLMTQSKAVITDSGGVQEETTALKIPCITIRENTERPVTVTEGSNVLIGSDMGQLVLMIEKVLANKWKKSTIPEQWDGKTADRVVKIIEAQNW
jgi:UDP-N-acetylglucosamine 2-epimerase (non-hydrolysing)